MTRLVLLTVVVLALCVFHTAVALPASFRTPEGAMTSYPAPLPSKMRFGELPPIIDTDTAPEECGNSLCVHGTCRKSKCDCDVGWKGQNCTESLECGGHGSMKNGTCKCDDGWHGDNCVLGPCPNDCSGRGYCYHDDHNRAFCICKFGSYGEDCGQSGCPNRCSGHGECVELAAGDGDETIALCRCNDGYGGQDCSVKTCPKCGEHGVCGHDHTCICEPGWGLADCSQRVCTANCSGHGTCQEGYCICEPGWLGEICHVPAHLCPNNCNGHGKCTPAGCACMAEFGGQGCELSCPKGCSGRGKCIRGVCLCDDGFGQPDCSSKRCPGDCSGDHGLCTEDGICKCHAPWSGPSCSIRECPNQCSGHGVCVSANGTCVCDGPLMADPTVTSAAGVNSLPIQVDRLPSAWPFGYWGVDCSFKACPSGCSGPGHGSCNGLTGKCTCLPGYVGDDCKEEACDLVCGAHGHCPNKRVGCVCDVGYKGTHCEQRYCINDCNQVQGQGMCMNKTCVCNRGWTGEDCGERQCPTALAADSDLRFKHDGHNNTDPLACTQHGLCVNGTCYCDQGFKGRACHLATCPNDCSNQGICRNGTCECINGWVGKDCSTPFTQVSNNCKNNCSGNGVCHNGVCYCISGKYFGDDCSQVRVPCPEACALYGNCEPLTGRCICHQGRTGEDCSKQLCIPDSECSGHGSCEPTPARWGECLCDEGWGGIACEMKACDKPCSGNGQCFNGMCYCDKGYGGADCADELCPNSCNGRGRCKDYGCACYTGWSGPGCDKPLVECPANCSGHGNCTFLADKDAPHGVIAQCACAPGWAGPGCDQAICVNGCHEQQNKGRCVSPGICECSENYYGHDCGKQRCPRDCSFNGQCNGFTCECRDGYGGDDCSVLLGCSDTCNIHGTCVGDKCKCDQGWTGVNCDMEACPRNCSRHGVCDPVTLLCNCKPAFNGTDCSDLINPVMCQADCTSQCDSDRVGEPSGTPPTAVQNQSREQCVANCITENCSPKKKLIDAANAQQQQIAQTLDKLKQDPRFREPFIDNNDSPDDAAEPRFWW